MPPKKRKSNASAGPATSTLPAKRARRSSNAAAMKDETQAPATPTGVKRGRGRPRKNPEAVPAVPASSAPTASTDTPVKRGRGRPPKNPADKVTTPKATAKAAPKAAETAAETETPKRTRGRPKKNPAPNGDDGAGDNKEEQSAESGSASAKEDYVADEGGRRYWLMKAEPESRLEKGVDVKFSIDDLQAATEPEAWDGVRNAVARNHMRAMNKGDYAFFYHSNCKVPGIAGYMEIVKEHSVDETAFDPANPYHDEKSSRDNPKWSVVHVEFRGKFNDLISLNDLKSHATAGEPLENLQTLRQSRLSVSSVTPQQWKFIMGLAEEQEKESEDQANGQDEQGEQEEQESDQEKHQANNHEDEGHNEQEKHEGSEGDSKATFTSAPEDRPATSE